MVLASQRTTFSVKKRRLSHNEVALQRYSTLQESESRKKGLTKGKRIRSKRVAQRKKKAHDGNETLLARVLTDMNGLNLGLTMKHYF